MMELPEKVRRPLEKLVKEDVCGLCLFGSWSRGDVVASSDVDLLVVTAPQSVWK